MSFGAQCGTCGFRYADHNGHIIPCPVCALAAFETMKRLRLTCVAWDDGSGKWEVGPEGISVTPHDVISADLDAAIRECAQKIEKAKA